MIGVDGAVTGIGRSSLGGTIYCVNCNTFCRSTNGSNVRYSNTADSAFMIMAVHEDVFRVRSGGLIDVNFSTVLSTAETSAEANTHYAHHGILVSNSGISNTSSKVIYTDIPDTLSTVVSVMIGRGNSLSVGYDNNGYVSFDPNYDRFTRHYFNNHTSAYYINAISSDLSASKTGILSDLLLSGNTYWPGHWKPITAGN